LRTLPKVGLRSGCAGAISSARRANTETETLSRVVSLMDEPREIPSLVRCRGRLVGRMSCCRSNVKKEWALGVDDPFTFASSMPPLEDETALDLFRRQREA